MQKPFLRLLIYLCLLLSVTETFAQDERLETARRHLVRGTAAIEVAKSSSDLQAAAQEFRKATELAPEMAAAWFNLGAVESKLKRYAEAIAAYQRYLQLNPKAENVQKVQDEIVKLEFHKEREAKKQGIAGTWISRYPVSRVSGEVDYLSTTVYKATLDGDIVRLEGSDPRTAGRETVIFSSTAYEGFKRDSLLGSANVGGNVDSVFIGRLDGDRIVGERIRSAFLDKTTTCKVDEHRTPFEARFEDDGKTLVISYKEPRYSLLWDYVSMFNATTICSRVVPEQAEQMEFRLTQTAQERVGEVATVQTLPVLNSPAKGPENAPVTLTVFSDFQCKYCSQLVPLIDEVAARNPTTVRVVFKQFPLRMHNFAEPAALASLAAHEQGKFWPMHDKLFANFSQLSDEKIRAIAQEVGLDLARFDQDRTSQKLRDEVLRDQALGQQAGVQGTPTLFLNGRVLRERSAAAIQGLIDQEVVKVGAVKKR